MTNPLVVATSNRTLSSSVRWTEAKPPHARAAFPVKVALRALGPVEATVSGAPVDLGAPKQRALLALLVSQVGQPVTVDTMLEALWAGHPPRSAMTSLQAYVANLRRLLEPDRPPRAPATVLRTCPRSYLLDSAAVDVDVRRFGEHATAGLQACDQDDPQRALTEFEAGLALWRGQPFLEVAYVPCVLPEVARLEELRMSVVEQRCAALLAVGALDVAVSELGALTKANPLREYGCELLSLALYRAGRQADALEVLRTIEKRLTEELGLDPKPTLQQLKHEILNQAPALDWKPIPAAPIAPVLAGSGGHAVSSQVGPQVGSQVGTIGPPPSPQAEGEIFVGREPALRRLTEALAKAKAGSGRVVTVCGEPGIGKTSLLRRFAKQVGVPVLWGTCPEHIATPPLWLWEQVLRAAGTCLPRYPIPAPVAELLDGRTRQAVDAVDAAGATLRRFEAIVQYLTEVSQSAPLVVVLDHLHRADPDSLRLLAHLAEWMPASRLLLVVAYGSHEAPVLSEALAALARREMTRIELKGLTNKEVRTLAGALLDQEVGKHTAEGLRARTEGNPFFLRELIKVLAIEQSIDDPYAATVPAPVREVVLRRVARLPRPAAEVLAVAAIAGRHFDIEVVAEVMSTEIDAVLEILDSAIAAGLIVEDQQRLGWFRFVHPLVAEALFEATGRLRRARLHRRIGVAVGRAGVRKTEKTAEKAAEKTAEVVRPAAAPGRRTLEPAGVGHASTLVATALRTKTPEEARTAMASPARRPPSPKSRGR